MLPVEIIVKLTFLKSTVIEYISGLANLEYATSDFGNCPRNVQLTSYYPCDVSRALMAT